MQDEKNTRPGQSPLDPDAQVARRRYKDTDATLPLLGFGLMRLPLKPGTKDIDYDLTGKLFDRAMKAGVNYFDTAHMYIGGKSQNCAGDLLSKYPRDSYYLAHKMPVGSVKKEEDVPAIFEDQLRRTKTGHFDFYLLHALNGGSLDPIRKFKVYDYLLEQKKAGRIRRLGFSFHDSPEALKKLLDAYEFDFTQIQLNYLDWDEQRAKEQYEILTGRGIPVIVMEPLRGGKLATLNAEANLILREANPNVSIPSWAFRFVGSLPNVLTILSGMNAMFQLEDNIRTFSGFQPLTDAERATIDKAVAAYKKTGEINCTGCRYCQPCPVGVDIPRAFGIYNSLKNSGDSASAKERFLKIPADNRPSECVSCGRCMAKCPQHLEIPALLKKINAELSSL